MINRACISLGEKCNLKCKYCHFENRLSNKTQEFTEQELIEVIDNIYEYVKDNKIEQFKVGIVGAGEPLLEFEKIKRLIEYVKEHNMVELNFYTISNGTVINERIIDFFLKNKGYITLCFSLDGPEDVHNYGREQFTKVFDKILLYENKFGIKPPVNCTVHKSTFENRNSVLDFFKTKGFRSVTFSRLVDRDESPYYITNTEYILFIEESRKYSFTVRQLQSENHKKYDCTMYGKLCGVGKNNPFITKEGVFPCGRFYGNNNFNYGSYSKKLIDLQEMMSQMKELKDGECYYNKYIQEGI